MIAIHNLHNCTWWDCSGSRSLSKKEHHEQNKEITRRMPGLGRRRWWMKRKISLRKGGLRVLEKRHIDS